MSIFKKSRITIAAVSACALLTLPSLSAKAAKDGEHHYPAHVPGVFLGITDGDPSEFTFGAEYEYRWNKNFGAGFIVEHLPGYHNDDGATVGVGLVHYHPYGGWRLSAGLGKKWVHGDHPSNYNLARLGVAYDFEVNGLGIAPTFNVDFVNNKEVIVYGIAITKHF